MTSKIGFVKNPVRTSSTPIVQRPPVKSKVESIDQKAQSLTKQSKSGGGSHSNPAQKKDKKTLWMDIYNKIVPNFKPENIKSYYSVPEGRPAPINFVIETPSNFNQSSFDVHLPPLYTSISHVSLVSYTIIGPPLDSNGVPYSTGFNNVHYRDLFIYFFFVVED
jgi:hypothetical protein